MAVCFSGSWFVFACGSKLGAADTARNRSMCFQTQLLCPGVIATCPQLDRDPFVFDCSTAEKKPRSMKDDNSEGGETGSDRILAFAASPSGKLVALTDDNKRLVLFECEPAWRCISIRCVVRRCTSLLFSRAEDELLVADKSGDVYSFSVVEPQAEGELKMGHLSMLLAVTMSPDDRYVITADRDEKIRVSHLRSPYNIQSFCLGHQQFVSALLVPSGRPRWLLSGSGDGTVKLWEYESGRKLQSCELEEADTQKVNLFLQNESECTIISSPDARHVAVQCERVSTLQFFSVDEDSEDKLLPHSRLVLPHCPLDVTFDPAGRLWALMDCDDEPIRVYSHRRDRWEPETESPELNRVCETFRPHWDTLEASARSSSRFDHLYKVTYDNVAAYLQKKQQRLEEQQLKRTKAQEANGSKKAKKSETS
ncbi:tRNA (guanine-N(7)-)-methyltransferase non-catalytic subunit wdr4 [Collichthys lucidus]|uniref:tRNA (Guanine-N(7)-)-methyltransferase non-catalytic subunit wdr4 n=1 Tax=Collichthys lucidus TaxID=240159 RepID=A0A4U5TZ59_COLLU|nr:tRNA (guanine-N(7)-)-methyltransferase non-catalytic subunit wdr4 [Collichthys lucidus]